MVVAYTVFFRLDGEIDAVSKVGPGCSKKNKKTGQIKLLGDGGKTRTTLHLLTLKKKTVQGANASSIVAFNAKSDATTFATRTDSRVASGLLERVC